MASTLPACLKHDSEAASQSATVVDSAQLASPWQSSERTTLVIYKAHLRARRCSSTIYLTNTTGAYLSYCVAEYIDGPTPLGVAIPTNFALLFQKIVERQHCRTDSLGAVLLLHSMQSCSDTEFSAGSDKATISGARSFVMPTASTLDGNRLRGVKQPPAECTHSHRVGPNSSPQAGILPDQGNCSCVALTKK